MKCNLAICLRTIDAVYLEKNARVSCLKKVVHVLCGPRESLPSTEEGVGMGNGEERNTGSFG